MTLVEVVASLALLGSLLGAAVVAQARLSRQWDAAQQRAAAVEVLNTQLETWHATPPPPEVVAPEANNFSTTAASILTESNAPVSGEGPLPVEPWWWRAEALQDQPGEDRGVLLIRYTAFDPADPERRAIATVDLFHYNPPPPAQAPEDSPTIPEAGVLARPDTEPSPFSSEPGGG